jgi:hypothetical protein
MKHSRMEGEMQITENGTFWESAYGRCTGTVICKGILKKYDALL